MWYRFKSGKHHKALAQRTMFGPGKTCCGLPIDELAVSIPIATLNQTVKLTPANVCKHCFNNRRT